MLTWAPEHALYRSLVRATEYLDAGHPAESVPTSSATSMTSHGRRERRRRDLHGGARTLQRSPNGGRSSGDCCGPAVSACCLPDFPSLSTPTHDYFRFTSDGLAELFSGFREVTIMPLGTRLGSAWMLIPQRPRPFGWLVSLVNPAIASLPARRVSAPCGFLVRAVR